MAEVKKSEKAVEKAAVKPIAKMETHDQLVARSDKEAVVRKADAEKVDVVPAAGSPGGPQPNTREAYAPTPEEIKGRVQKRRDHIVKAAAREKQAKQMAEDATHGLYPYGAGGLGVSGSVVRAHKAAERGEK